MSLKKILNLLISVRAKLIASPKPVLSSYRDESGHPKIQRKLSNVDVIF